jgi:hypothetical protein
MFGLPYVVHHDERSNVYIGRALVVFGPILRESVRHGGI